MKATHNSYGEDSGFDVLFESEATEKTGLVSEISDSSSPDAEQLDKDKNYHDYTETLTDIRNKVDKKSICKKKKVRMNEDITDISLIPDRFYSCVNYKNGYNEYKQDKHTDRQKDSRNNRGNTVLTLRILVNITLQNGKKTVIYLNIIGK